MTSRLRTGLALLLLPLSLMGLGAVLVAVFFLTLPDVRQLEDCVVATMNNVKLCPRDATYTPYNQISPDVINAVVASEDAAFFFHQGFDWNELKASLTTNLQNRGYKRGGSTITQQLAKNVFLGKEKSLLRKLREAALTLDIERRFTKNQILERYLNVVEFGPNLYGIRAAAHFYFKKEPRDLHVLEASFLAFLLPNPKVYSQSRRQGTLTPFARKMIEVILRRLEGFKKISPETLASALSHVDDFPWLNLSRGELSTNETSLSTSPTSNDVIEKFLEEEAAADEKSSNATTSSGEPEPPDSETTTTTPESEEESSTWD